MSISSTDRKGSVQGPTIRIDPSVHIRLKVYSARNGRSIQDIAAAAITRHLDFLDEQEAHADDVA
jgi:predicted HicB family RNase H-like nuclease